MVPAELLFRRTPGVFQYIRADGAFIIREYSTALPNGQRSAGHWIYRSPNREYIDHDVYLSNLLQRNKLAIDVN